MDITKNSSNKKRLGRGIGSLLQGSGIQEASGFDELNNQDKRNITTMDDPPKKSGLELGATEGRVWNIAIDKLVPGIYQPRKTFEKISLQELSESIKQNGILQPIVVRKRTGGGFEIIAGERRWRAAQIAGLHEVPSLIREVSDRDALQIAIIENIQREDLDAIDEAEGYQRLIEEFAYSQQEVAEKVGKERSTVTNALRLLQLPREIKEMVTQKNISTGHAKALLSLHDKTQQLRLAKAVVEKNLSVRALEQAIKNRASQIANSPSEPENMIEPNIATKLAQELANQLQKALGTKVEISYKLGKGLVSLHFYSDDQLTQIYEKLKA